MADAWRAIPGMTRAGLLILAALGAVALLAPIISPAPPNAYFGLPLLPPGPGRPLGTNDVGNDLLTELFFGARTSLLVGTLAAAAALSLSTAAAIVAGYRGGLVDAIVMRVVDFFLVMPRLPLLLLLVTLAGPSTLTLVVVIALLSWPWGARIIRGQVRSLRARTHVRAAALFGAGTWYVARRHLLPEMGPILASQFVAGARFAVLMEAGLGFLGLSPPGAQSWGITLHYALIHPGLYFGTAWVWWVLPPALALTSLILGFTLVGTGLEERWNPRLGLDR